MSRVPKWSSTDETTRTGRAKVKCGVIAPRMCDQGSQRRSAWTLRCHRARFARPGGVGAVPCSRPGSSRAVRRRSSLTWSGRTSGTWVLIESLFSSAPHGAAGTQAAPSRASVADRRVGRRRRATVATPAGKQTRSASAFRAWPAPKVASHADLADPPPGWT